MAGDGRALSVCERVSRCPLFGMPIPPSLSSPTLKPLLSKQTPEPPCTGEVRAKYSGTMMEVFRETFCALPLAFVLASKVFVCHGGLFSRDGVTLDDIRKLDRCARAAGGRRGWGLGGGGLEQKGGRDGGEGALGSLGLFWGCLRR